VLVQRILHVVRTRQMRAIDEQYYERTPCTICVAWQAQPEERLQAGDDPSQQRALRSKTARGS
jgi:hypothetical protein